LFGTIGSGGKVTNLTLSDFDVSGENNVGILAGRINGATVINCSVNGTVYGSSYVGGLAGITLSTSTIETSYAKADVTGTNYAGGFVGQHSGKISDCYATGNVERSSGTNTYFAGFAGYNSQGNITRSFSNGNISFPGETPTSKGFVGGVATGGNYHDSANFFDNETSGQNTTSGNAVGKNTSDMKNIETFSNAGWDIEYTNTDLNEGYPYLSWQLGNSPTWILKGGIEPEIPTSFTATTFNDTRIDLTWTKGINATHTYIEYREGDLQPPSWYRGDGSFLYNGTDESYSHTGLNSEEMYLYRAWSYNSTNGLWNETYANDVNTTEAGLTLNISITPSSIDFGTVDINSFARTTGNHFNITNDGLACHVSAEISNTVNWTFVNLTERGHNKFSVNWSDDEWTTEENIKIGGTYIKSNLGNLAWYLFDLKLITPTSIAKLSDGEEFTITLTATPS
jgi:hypothetical protein